MLKAEQVSDFVGDRVPDVPRRKLDSVGRTRRIGKRTSSWYVMGLSVHVDR